MALGKKVWAIAEGYIPPDDASKPPEFISHETGLHVECRGYGRAS